ncbi:MAG: hypothetical protein OHK0046_10380 [Anaerolineae bacterium]
MSKYSFVAEPGTLSIEISRMFDAPRDLIFKAMTDPNLIPQWWGPYSVTTVVDKLELRRGGIWRFLQSDENGEYAFSGVFHTISPERMVFTFEFETMPEHVLLDTIILEEVDGKTRVTDLSVFQTVAARDGMLNSGMEQGSAEGWDRLDALLVGMKA